MDETEQAHNELDRLTVIISRHEGHMITLRGWFLAIIGGLLATYYSEQIDMSVLGLIFGLFMIVVLFLVLESRYVNLVEAPCARAVVVEKSIVDSRQSGGPARAGWYDGPKVSEACQEGAERWWPRPGMTLVLNQAFYGVVILVIVFTLMWLPTKRESPPKPGEAPPAQK